MLTLIEFQNMTEPISDLFIKSYFRIPKKKKNTDKISNNLYSEYGYHLNNNHYRKFQCGIMNVMMF